MKLTEDIKYIGVDDLTLDLFEGLYTVENGVSYNSYVILDEKVAVMDTVDKRVGNEWLAKLTEALNGRKVDYLVIQHMEPDHSSNIKILADMYPEMTVVGNTKTFIMTKAYFGTDFGGRNLVVKEGDKLNLGKRELSFIMAPMVHWPEVMMTYDSYDKVLFSADAFGKFGALEKDESWTDEARRYYINIVGKYGNMVQSLLKKASTLDIKKIFPLHGPMLTENLGEYINKYLTWSSYSAESKGVLIAYTSVYGHTREGAEKLGELFTSKGISKVILRDLARKDMANCVAESFQYSHIIFASTTYDAGLFPIMEAFLGRLVEKNFQNKVVGFMENGSWAPVAGKEMRKRLEGCKNLTFAENTVTIRGALNDVNRVEMQALADEFAKDF